MKTHELVFIQPHQVELQEREIDTGLAPHQALVASECSLVSAGTEGAGFTGLIQEMPSTHGKQNLYPQTTGYGH